MPMMLSSGADKTKPVEPGLVFLFCLLWWVWVSWLCSPTNRLSENSTIECFANINHLLLHHQCSTGGAKHCLLSLLLGLLQPQWTMDGEKSAWHGQIQPSKAAMVAEQLDLTAFQPNAQVNSNQVVDVCRILMQTPQHSALPSCHCGPNNSFLAMMLQFGCSPFLHVCLRCSAAACLSRASEGAGGQSNKSSQSKKKQFLFCMEADSSLCGFFSALLSALRSFFPTCCTAQKQILICAAQSALHSFGWRAGFGW